MAFTRREFLSASAAGAASLALPSTRPSVLGANERLGVGVIGCGGQGTHHLTRLVGTDDVRVVGVCDIYRPRREHAASISSAEGYTDYRALLDRQDLDAVWIATPDHWHSRMAIDAMDAGKDVYCEKPMARYWHEARDFYRATLRTRRVVQIGSQDTSRPMWRRGLDLIREGKLGKLVWSQTSIARNVRDGDWTYGIDLNVTPRDLDWKAFLGPAPDRPYDPERFFRWRKYWDYSGGIATDLFVHVLHSLCITLGNEFPVRVVSAGGVWVHRDRETPDTFHAIIDYPGEHNVIIAGTQANEQGLPVVVRGHEATMYLGGGDIVIRPERAFGEGRAEERFPVTDIEDPIAAHHRNFIDCVRRRDARTNCHPELGYKVDVAVDMAIESYRQNKVMRFDPVREEMIG